MIFEERHDWSAEYAVEALEALSAAMQKAVGHFPFHRNGVLYCDCGWRLENGGKLDWWVHIEEEGFVVGRRPHKP